MRRAASAVIAALAISAAGWGATTLGGAAAVDAVDGASVGDERLAPAAIESEATRLARQRPRRLPAARRAAADRAIERLWLQGEAAARGLRLDSDAARSSRTLLRGAVADALAGAEPERDARRFAHAFDSFHVRWRSRTRCAIAYQDPYADRCANLAAARAGTCRWMGEATLCALAGGGRARWLIVQDAASVGPVWRAAKGLPSSAAARLRQARHERDSLIVRLRSRARAAKLVLAVYESARTLRERASRRVRRAQAVAAAARAAAARREASERERTARRLDPNLSEPALAAAREACARQVAASDPYTFAFGMQDVVGGAEGLIAARTALLRRLSQAARDVHDRRRLRPLRDAVVAGNRELARLAAAGAGDDRAVARLVARFDARTEPERARARRLDLGDCLVRPAR